jgi:hypothetical protein
MDMRLCSYVVVHDTGFAPNPFHGYCTLAACTPNHLGVHLDEGHWLVGNSTAATGNRLIYAMRITEVMDFDDYFRDPRFAAKKPRDDTGQNRCGDNIYYRDESGAWRQALAFHHIEPGSLEKDTKNPRVFISDYFFYFGDMAPNLPAEFGSLIQMRQGCRCNHEAETVAAFVEWLTSTYTPGLHGPPRDTSEAAANRPRMVQLGYPNSRRRRRA